MSGTQDQVQASGPAPTAADPEIKLTLSLSRINLILNSLARMPFGEVAPLVNDIAHQAQNQPVSSIQQAVAAVARRKKR